MEPALDLILGSDFNHDFHVTLDSTVTPVQYNYRDENLDGERHGLIPASTKPSFTPTRPMREAVKGPTLTASSI